MLLLNAVGSQTKISPSLIFSLLNLVFFWLVKWKMLSFSKGLPDISNIDTVERVISELKLGIENLALFVYPIKRSVYFAGINR